MKNKDNEKILEFASDEFVNEMYLAAVESFCGGIFVNYGRADKDIVISYDIHPCGWDFVSFENIDNDYKDECVYNYLFQVEDFSNGIYSQHPLEGKTLKEILQIVGRENWNFEL